MIAELKGADEPDSEGGSLTLLTALALVVGAISGAVVALFMLLLEQADRLRGMLMALAHAEGPQGFWLLAAACAAATGVAASLVRRISPRRPAAASRKSRPFSRGECGNRRFASFR